VCLFSGICGCYLSTNWKIDWNVISILLVRETKKGDAVPCGLCLVPMTS